MTRRPFFIGWSGSVDPELRRFLWRASLGLLLGVAALGGMLGAVADEPGGPGFGSPAVALPALPGGPLEGVLTAWPYPVLHMPADPAHPTGRAVLLGGGGKDGLPGDLASLDGASVRVEGVLLRRGSIEMLATDQAPLRIGLSFAAPKPEALGRWRIVGEICDGKCAAGVMVPGSGIAHRACANLCLSGTLPAILVTAAPVLDHSYLLLGSPDGGPMPETARRLVGARVVIEGELERHGPLLVLRADFQNARPQ